MMHQSHSPSPRSLVRKTTTSPSRQGRHARDPLPDFVAPQLALLMTAPPLDENYLQEIKFDGYRVLARLEQVGRTPEIHLFTRNGNDWTDRFPTVAEAVASLAAESAFLDGEVVALDAQGRSRFQRLQNALSDPRDTALYYFVFDLLYLNGHDLRALPLIARKERLAALLACNPHPLLRYSEHWTGRGEPLLRRCCAAHLEGIVCKDRRQPYTSGRNAGWVKVKCKNRQEFIVIGYTHPRGTRAHLGALLLATHDPDGRLRYSGRVGTGMGAETLRDLKTRLAALETAAPPIAGLRGGRDVTWVHPRLVAEIEFSEFTAEGILRHAAFMGLRADKPAAQVVRETPAAAGPGRTPESSRRKGRSGAAASPLTHPDKVLFTPDGPTKGELADYYARVQARMWPYVQGHPLSLLRCPDGTGRPCFFQKHIAGSSPVPGLAAITVADKTEIRQYRFVETPEGLRSLVQLGVLELHLWGARAEDVEHPVELVFDLDPAPEVTWERTIAGAVSVRKLLQRLGLRSFLKLSGGKGMHLHVPIAPRYCWEQIKSFCHAVARQLAQAQPELFTAALPKRERTGKIFIDYLRNGRGATYIAPFSARARPGAPIAAPISWAALGPQLRPDYYTVRTAGDYLRDYPRDPWAGYAALRQPIALLDEHGAGGRGG